MIEININTNTNHMELLSRGFIILWNSKIKIKQELEKRKVQIKPILSFNDINEDITKHIRLYNTLILDDILFHSNKEINNRGIYIDKDAYIHLLQIFKNNYNYISLNIF